MDKKFELVISIVDRGHSDAVVEASREAGANGGTIIYGRGTSPFEKDSIMGVSIQPEKEIIMTLTPTDNKTNIMKTICEKAHSNEKNAPRLWQNAQKTGSVFSKRARIISEFPKIAECRGRCRQSCTVRADRQRYRAASRRWGSFREWRTQRPQSHKER